MCFQTTLKCNHKCTMVNTDIKGIFWKWLKMKIVENTLLFSIWDCFHDVDTHVVECIQNASKDHLLTLFWNITGHFAETTNTRLLFFPVLYENTFIFIGNWTSLTGLTKIMFMHELKSGPACPQRWQNSQAGIHDTPRPTPSLLSVTHKPPLPHPTTH